MSDVSLTVDEWAAMLDNPMRDRSYQFTPLGRHITEYLGWKETEQGAAARTIESYEYELARLSVRCLKHPAHVDRAEMRRVIGSFPAGTRPKVTSIYRDFWAWMREERHVVSSPMEGIRSPRRKIEKVYKVFSEGEEAAIVTAGPDTRYGFGIRIRDKACILLLLRTGLRRDELIHLRVGDVDLSEKWLIVRSGKGGKPRVVPIRGELVRALEEYMLTPLPRIGRTPSPDDYLFYAVIVTGGSLLCERDTQVLSIDMRRPVAGSTAWRWWAGCLERANVEYRSPHMARHTYATKLLRSGSPLPNVGKALGHAPQSSATLVYLHADVADLARDVERMENERVLAKPHE